MQASNSLLRPRPTCLAIRPQVRTVSDECLVRTRGLLRALVPSGGEDLPRIARRFPARPLPPENISCFRVVEGGVRGLLLAIALIAVGMACFRTDASGMQAKSFTVNLRPEVKVKGPKITLADIADLTGNDEALLAQLAHAPMGTVTETRILSRKEIADLLRNTEAGKEELIFAGADFTRISPSTRALSLEDVVPVLRSYLVSVTSWRAEEIDIRSIDNLKSMQVPEGEIGFRVASRSIPSNLRSALLQLELLVDGKPQRSHWIKADIGVRAQVVQVAQPVAFRNVLKPADLREVVVDIGDPTAEYVRTAEEAVGKVATRALRPGECLTRRLIDDADIVRSGMAVKLLVETGSLRLSIDARALQNGKMGDRIKVRNIDSDRVVTAVVTGPGEVRVTN
jgi:flagellar basal body P-ring formation protein FlgA